MMWVFAIIIVLAMGGVAMVAAGHGAPLAPAYDDRPDATVPGYRPLAAGDLRRVRFSLAVRGYRMSEVDALLRRLATEMEAAAAHRETTLGDPGHDAGDGASEDEQGSRLRAADPIGDNEESQSGAQGPDRSHSSGRGVPHGGDEASDR
ncbi:DivIVA domain-containing protein [Nocardioides sp.]|uniref:DivIVA domain-containing protein n=1 Tax=Nocardioides sp. TaxID=35761 RepID=UPI0035168AF7